VHRIFATSRHALCLGSNRRHGLAPAEHCVGEATARGSACGHCHDELRLDVLSGNVRLIGKGTDRQHVRRAAVNPSTREISAMAPSDSATPMPPSSDLVICGWVELLGGSVGEDGVEAFVASVTPVSAEISADTPAARSPRGAV